MITTKKTESLKEELSALLNMPDEKVNFSDIPELNFDRLGKPVTGKFMCRDREVKMSINVNLTESATTHIQKEIQKHQAIGIRLSTKKAGCSGLKYVVDYVHADHSYGEPACEKNGVAVFVANEDVSVLQKVQKLTIDYAREGLNGRLVFNNENESGRCGCGESFTTD